MAEEGREPGPVVEEGREPGPVVEEGRQARLETSGVEGGGGFETLASASSSTTGGAGSSGGGETRPGHVDGTEYVADWRPKVIALDIDGTLLKWVEGSGAPAEAIARPVYDAINRAYDAGAHIVLASGRSPHGMTRVADLLDLPREGHDRLWIVASNGAVILRYPPLDVVHEETFDAGPAVRAIMREQPSALVAIEERGVGYRLNDHFPPGELSGEMIVTPLEELIAKPVSRVIIRNPSSSAEEFVELGRRLGLQGISYVVGWTAWLDLTPVGVSKASGLSYVVGQLGLEPADVLAIGDGRNDLEMLSWAGRGVAMGQAVPEVHEVADATTASVDEDGAAVEIGQWF